ncbi:MAG: C40 family peptidase, partial [Henriciella sp.]|nr:C40 family peptidase [Henriciella sp.]
GAWAGDPIDDWQAPGALRRNDLIFWQGHVGIMLDSETLLHANGYHMAVAAEPLAGSVARIATQYGEPVGARRIDLDMERDRKPDWLRV